ncbi:hypothetical protein BB560_004543 [Smittium megazygosporum]|uniref:CCHC-type domain-containing protein n=1 Tax=Smittium megazygosporum TaxID=133381 RepID=A0A2T9Z8Y7_9FUNG|nr:hypothetical protein BB560_004543 [Smittium megazygosporum]
MNLWRVVYPKTKGISRRTYSAHKLLTLILQKKVVRKDPNELECFTCGKRGHISKFCRARLNDSTADGIKAKEDNIQSPKSGMLAVLPPKEEEEEEAKMLASQVIGNKRIRIEDLIEQQESRPIKELSSRLGLEKKKKSKKKQQLRIRYSPLAEKVLDSNANLTIREFLRTIPRLYKEIGQTMRKEPGLRKNSLYAEIENKNKSKTVDMEPVYIIFEINERNIPALVDTGATYSLISSLTVRIEEEIEVCLPVLILAECTVLLLLGMGACKTLGMRIDLKKDEVSLSANNKKIKVPIYQKEALMNSDQEDSKSEISEVEDLEVSSDDEYSPMFYAAQKADISETVQLHFEQSENSKKLDGTPEEIRDIINTNSNLFSTEIKIIKDSDFLIKVPDDPRPFNFKLRRNDFLIV